MEHTIKIEAPEGKLPVYNVDSHTITFIDEDVKKRVKDYDSALEVLGELEPDGYYNCPDNVRAMIRCNTIIRALNMGHTFDLTTGTFYYPYLVFYLRGKQPSDFEQIGRFTHKGKTYVVGGCADYGSNAGLGRFFSHFSVGDSRALVGYACKDRETALYFAKTFAEDFFEALYGDKLNFEWIK